VTAVRHGLARVVATSGTRSDTAAVLVNLGAVTLTLDAGRAVTATVGVQGDTLRATGADGTKYRLAIPPRALMQPVAITMTPIGGATGVPLTGGLAGGVDLKPSGLVFVSPATLVMETTKQPPAGQRLVGLTYRRTGTELSLAPAAAVAGGFKIPVGHFSGAAAGFGTAQDVDAIYFGTPTRSFTEDFYAAALVSAASRQPPNPAAELAMTFGTIPSTVTSGDIGFVYGRPFDLKFDVQANAAMETGRSGVNASAKASLRYRWRGMQGLPPGAVVRSATGIDWSKPAP